ncbi:MAG: RnfABCDGE type electron transport complex subunit D [Clostridia bacterium]|nr:RnfABCDGE type electron transport complex subunit D [Clostridia bacterium]
MNNSLLNITASPHIHSHHSTRNVMLDVILALLPTTVAGVIIFGMRALLVVAVCVFTAIASEFVFNLAVKKQQTIDDLSAIVTGLLLALNLPANIPIWQAVVGSVFAIVVVKCFFGGIGKNIVNPAITARVFMLIAFGSMAKAAFPVDSVASATPLAEAAETGAISTSLWDLFIGNHGGTIGETCTLALILGGIYLLLRRVIQWHLPVAFIGTAYIFTLILVDFDFVAALSFILSGGLFIGAIYMATDYVTSPATSWGQLLFGAGCGIFAVIIRHFGQYPEGVSFAILLMNILTPYIDIWTARKPFGGKKA